MKKNKIVYMRLVKTFAIVIIIASAVRFSNYIFTERDSIVLWHMLYDGIEYNGHVYHMSKDQYYPSKKSKERGPIYLRYKDSKINYEPFNTASVYEGYEGYEEEIYIFFDTAMFIRDDYRFIEDQR